MTRKFKLIDPNRTELMPRRSTKYAAGYDFRSSEDITIEPLRDFYSKMSEVIFHENSQTFGFEPIKGVKLVHTGVTVEMNPDDYMLLANRSSNGVKRYLLEPNGVGIIDADYTGEIMIPLVNFGTEPYTIKQGDRIAQGIFQKYETVDDDVTPDVERQGGFGSTGEA